MGLEREADKFLVKALVRSGHVSRDHAQVAYRTAKQQQERIGTTLMRDYGLTRNVLEHTIAQARRRAINCRLAPVRTLPPPLIPPPQRRTSNIRRTNCRLIAGRQKRRRA